MKTTFKKTLLAAAVAGFSLNAVAAVDVVTNSTAVTYSTERLANTATTVTIPRENFVVTLGAEYAVGDIIKFTFSNDAIAASQFRSTITSSDTLLGTGLPDANVAGATITLGLLSSDATSVTYRVTEVSTAATTVGQKFTIAANATFAATASKVLSGLTVTYAAETSNGVTIDAGTKSSFQLVHTGSEFSVTAPTKLNATIDVEESRLLFSNVGGHSTTVDRLDVTTTQAAGIDTDGTGPLPVTNFTNPVTFTSVKHTITGDFSWVEDADANTAGIQPDTSTLTLTGCAGAADADDATWTATSVSFTCTTAAAINVDFDITQGGAKAPVTVPTTSYSLESLVTYNVGTAKTATFGPIDAGSWTLNGSQVRVPYMVVNNSRFGIIANVANHGSKDGAITLDVFAEDGTKLASNYAAGTSKAGSVTSVAAALKAALVAAGKDLDNTTKFSFQVTTNVPQNDVQVYAAYTDATTSERAIVNNDGRVQSK